MATITEKLAGVTREIDTLSTALQGTIVYFADAVVAVDDLATKTDGLAKQLSGVASAMADGGKRYQELVDSGMFDQKPGSNALWYNASNAALVEGQKIIASKTPEERALLALVNEIGDMKNDLRSAPNKIKAIEEKMAKLYPNLYANYQRVYGGNDTTSWKLANAELEKLQRDRDALALAIDTLPGKIAELEVKKEDWYAENKTTESTASQNNEEWYQAISSLKTMADAFEAGKYTPDNQGTANAVKGLMEQIGSAWERNAPIKTYQININGTSIKTIDDPTDLIALIEQLAAAKRRSL